MSRRKKAKTVDPKWIRTKADEYAITQGCYFDAEAGEYVCRFIETFCVQSEDRFKGQKLKLLDWERDFVMRLFSWKNADGTRRFTSAYLEIAKKNGKSTLLSALAIYFEVADGAGTPLIHLNACDRFQASKIFDEAARMVEASPDLAAILEVIPSAHRIVYKAEHGLILANSKVVDSKDGQGPSAVIFDEVHRLPNRKLWGVYRYAGVARTNFMRISLTTAGEDESGVWFDQRKLSEEIIEGTSLVTRHLGIVYRADPDDPLDDPATWRKANPSMGHTISESQFREELEEAKLNPIDWAEFLRLRLNIVVRGEQKFFRRGVWEACKTPHSIPLKGQKFWIGLDLSKIDDLTAMASVWRGPKGDLNASLKFWLPENNVVELERKHGQAYRVWAEMGLITLTPGDIVDYRWIRKDIKEQAKAGKLQKLLADPWHAQELLSSLQDEDGLPVHFLRQGVYSLAAPTKDLLRLVLSKQLNHADNLILNWCASNAVGVKDSNANVILSKEKSRDKIDGLAALVNAIAGAISASGGPKRSIYNDRGMISV